MKSRSRKTGSEKAQLVLVHSVMITALVAVFMLINTLAQASEARASRSVASVSHPTITVNSLDELPSCDVLRANGIEFVESDESDEWSIDDLCEVQ